VRSSRVRLADRTRADIDRTLRWMRCRFGSAEEERYRQLLEAAPIALAESPEPVLSRPLGPDRPGLRRLRIAAASPHYLVYRVGSDRVIEVIRLLHDAMDPARNLPAEDEDG
jgi:toxin ParE1/3/4